MQERLDKLYDEITDIENAIEEVETRLYNIRQDKSQKIMFTSSFYSLISCMINLQIWKEDILKSFLSDVFIYEEEQRMAEY